MQSLKRFDMLEWKAMATPMDSNLKLLADDSSELVDVTQYRQIIGSLMYLTNTRRDICFCCEHLNSISCSTKMGSPSSCKTCDEIYDGIHEYRLYGYTDADWAGSILDRKSTLVDAFA